MDEYDGGGMEITPLSYIQALARRPRMFTPNGTIAEIIAFLCSTRDEDVGSPSSKQICDDALVWIAGESAISVGLLPCETGMRAVVARFGDASRFLAELDAQFPYTGPEN